VKWLNCGRRRRERKKIVSSGWKKKEEKRKKKKKRKREKEEEAAEGGDIYLVGNFPSVVLELFVVETGTVLTSPFVSFIPLVESNTNIFRLDR
jgi:hypothetical protein